MFYQMEASLPVILCVIAVVFVLIVIMSMWKKIPQDKAAVVTGLKKRVITGGGTLVIPVLERVDVISLENIPLNISTTGAMTNQGVPIIANGVAVIKVKNDKDSILSSVEQFHTGREEATNNRIRETVNSVLEGKLREIVGKMTVEGIYKDREAFSNQVREVADISLKAMGFELIEFTIKEITDQNGYLEALGAPRIAEVKKDAEIAKAEADRDAQIKIAQAKKEGEEARILSETAIAEAEKEMSVKQSRFEKEAQTAKAEADAAYEIQDNIMNKTIIDTNADAEIIKQKRAQEIATEEMQVAVSKEQKNIELAKTKAEAKKRFLDETVVNPAEAARQEASLKAEADKVKAIKSAEAEARARELKTEAYKQYGEAAIIQMIIEALPQMAENIAKPLGNIDKVIVWDSGQEGKNGGAMKMAENVTKTLAATMDSVNEVTGFDVKRALENLTKAHSIDTNVCE